MRVGLAKKRWRAEIVVLAARNRTPPLTDPARGGARLRRKIEGMTFGLIAIPTPRVVATSIFHLLALSLYSSYFAANV